jgi:oligopeptidase A
VELDDADRARYNALVVELSQLSSQFSNNVLDATKAFSLRIDDPAVMQGASVIKLGRHVLLY